MIFKRAFYQSGFYGETWPKSSKNDLETKGII